MRNCIAFVICLFVFQPVYAQEIRGYVTDAETRLPVAGAIIALKDSLGIKIIRYTQTDNNGAFTLKANAASAPCYLIAVSLMGYAGKSIKTERGKNTYRILLEPKAVELKKVVVKPQKIRQNRDTLIYDVSGFADIQDRSIGDVLKKMPGIEISGRGGIKFNGIPINKFYIEGLDLLEGRYGLAVNNISRQDVKSIEIYENHQPVKALEDINLSTQAALNLKLKDKAKAQWIGSLKLGAGFTPFLWNGELFAMLAKAGMQSINTVKSNNMGTEILSEVKDYTLGDLLNYNNSAYIGSYYSAAGNFVPVLKDERWLFNESYLLSANNLWKLSGNYQLKNQLSYSRMKTDNTSSVSTEYFLPDGTRAVEEFRNAHGLVNNLAANVVLLSNKEKYYLKNTLYTDINWEETGIYTTGTYENFQRAHFFNFRIGDDFEIIKRVKNRVFSFKSQNAYQHKPQQLDITDNGEPFKEKLTPSLLYSYSTLSYAALIRKVALSVTGFAKMYLRDMEQSADAVDVPAADLAFTSGLGSFDGGASVKADYTLGNLLFSAEIPFHYHFYRIKRHGMKEDHNLVYASPGISIRYKPFPKIEFTASAAGWGRDLNNYRVYDGAILRNYRSIYIGADDLNSNIRHRISISGSYKNPMRSFFMNFSYSRNWITQNYLPERDFSGKYMINSYVKRPSGKRSLFLSGNINKGIDAINTLFTLNVAYLRTTADLLQDNILTPYVSSVVSIAPALDVRLARWVKITYECNYNYNVLRPENNNDAILKTAAGQLSEKVYVYLNPVKKVNIRIGGEHYYSEDTGDHKNSFFADVRASYRFSGRLEAGCDITNIFNYREFAYSFFDELSQVRSTYKLRPLNVLFNVILNF